MGRLLWVSLLSILIGSVFAQINYPNCTAGLTWLDNSLNQNPCQVAAYLEASCNGGQFSIPPLGPTNQYAGPHAGQGNTCQCNTVVYSLVSACAACQGEPWVSWSSWSFNCSVVAAASTYPNPIPGGTRLPHWAYIDVVTGNTWTVAAAQSAGDSPETTPTQHSTLQPASTASTAPQGTSGTSSKSSSNAGQIAGGVVGGIVGAALLAALAFWYLRRQRRRAEAQPSPYRDKPEEAYGLPDTTSGTTMSIGRFYDPSDPSTYPKPVASPTITAIQTTASTEHGHSTESRPYDRSRYPGLPLV